MKYVLYSFGGFVMLMMVLATAVGASYSDSELGGRYYGTNEWMWPVPSERNMSSPFGKRTSPTAGASSDHKGIDIPCVEGSDVVATKDGTYVNPLDYVDPKEKITYTTEATTGTRSEMVAYAKQFLGNPYVYGGTSLTNGTDCSGYTMRIYEHFGITIPRTAEEQYNASEKISEKDLLPGDLLFYKDKSGAIGHVTMYIGNNQVIHASSSTTGIIISSISYRTPCGYGRYIKANYSDEDMKYMAACIAAEALSNSKEGQCAVGYVVMNRVNANGFGSTVKEVVTAKNQFNSPWNSYLGNPPKWAKESAKAVLEGSANNPIGSKCFFISTAYAKELKIVKKGVTVGDNTFYDKCLW